MVTVQVEDATRRLPLEQPENASVEALLVYPKLDGFVPLKLFESEIVIDPTDTGVYVNVKEEDAAVGVTVSGAVPADPTLGVTVPPCDPSAAVTVMLPLKVPPVSDTVQVVEARVAYPLLGHPEKERTSADTA